MSLFPQILTILCAVGSGMASGAFLTFSTFTMAGLKRLPPSQGAATMQAINKEAPTPSFMVLLFGTGAACLTLMAYAAYDVRAPGSTWHLIAGALYLLGVVLMTIAYHVPRNDRLERLDPGSPEETAYWAVYQRAWVRMNHVRTIAPLVSAVLFAVSLGAE